MDGDEGMGGVLIDGTVPDPAEEAEQEPRPEQIDYTSEQATLTRQLAATLGSIANRTTALPDAKWAVTPIGVEPGPAAKEAAAAIAAHVTVAYTDRTALLRAVETVTALHRPSMFTSTRGPSRGKAYCVHCNTHAFDDGAVYPAWPCATVVAVCIALGLLTPIPPEKAT